MPRLIGNYQPLFLTGQQWTESLQLTVENSLPSLRILLVEDNPTNQLLGRDVLEDKQHIVTIANNGKEALDIYAEHDFDIILMDMQMPILDGYEAMRSIRKMTSHKRNIPILALTAHVIEGGVEKCKKAGATAYLSKPYEPKHLIATIASLWKNKESDHVLEHSAPAVESAVVHTGSVFNASRMLNLLGGSTKLAAKIKNIMISQFPQDIEKMEEALKAREWEVLGSYAHRIKPNIQMSTSDEWYHFVLSLEKDGKAAVNTESFPKRVETLKENISLLVKEMQSDRSY
ncbi:MAG: response regulator [Flavobacteriales bacterium]